MTDLRCTVLVVDDNPFVLDMLRALLASDFRVLTASSAEAARELFVGRDLDIVLSDQQLPGQSGVQLLEWARLHYPRTVRILITGLARLEDAVAAINCSQVHRFLFKPWEPDQLIQTLRTAARNLMLERRHDQLVEELRKLNNDLERRVQDRTSALEEANRQLQQMNSMLQKMALTDALTGLPNRRAMDRLARNELARRVRRPQPLTLGLIDADHFKDINSKFLLPGGDHALVWLGQTLTRGLRTVDTVGRIGGEEFMVVAPETDLVGAEALAERLRAAVANNYTEYNGQEIRLTVSIGVVVVGTNEPSPSYDELRVVAATALAQAKNGGRNRCVVQPIHALPPTNGTVRTEDHRHEAP